MSVAPFTAAYVRALAADRSLRAQISARLAMGKGWELKERLVVCMIDISGYSKMSAGLTFLGKMASEVITKTVGSFLSKIIDVVALYGGDIVRFLGDALLVAFSPEADQEDLSQAVLRSLACCLHVATCCKSVDLDMHLASTSQNPDHRRDPLMAELSSGAASLSSLYLHFAITAGPMSRVILGDPAWRMDYCVQGAGLRALGAILDNTTHGELGLSANALAELDGAIRTEVERRTNEKRIAGHAFLSSSAMAALTFIIFGSDAGTVANMVDIDVAKLFWAGRGLRSNGGPPQGRLAQFSLLPGSIADDDVDPDGEEFVRRFVNHSLLKRIDAYQPRAATWSSTAGGRRTSSVSRTRSSITMNARKSSVASEGQSTYTFGGGHEQQGGSPDGFAEFRSVATIFVALTSPFELEMVQKITLSFLRALKEHKGVFLQYSADDKGDTMLAIFGLPSYSHVNNSDQSAKCMKWFVDDLAKIIDGPFTKYISISISSGEILFTTLGNEYRSEVGLLGDVIVTAARLMPISGSKHAIVIDQETNDKVKLTHNTRDLGMVHLKGRANDCRIHALALEAVDGSPATTAANKPQFGYKHERKSLTERFESWRTEGRRAVVIIEAPSGLGKSTLGTFLTEHAGAYNIPTCLTQGSEMDQWRPFSGLEPLLVFIFQNLPSPDTLLVASSALKLAPSLKRSGSFLSVSRLPSRLNLRRQSSVDPSNASQAGGALGPAAQAFLMRAGVDLALAPLLGMVSAGFAIADSKLTKTLDAQAKINFVKSLVTKIVTAFVMEFKAVFLFDDAQWFDSHTLDVLMALARYCPKIFIQVLTRPLSLSENQSLERALAFPDTSHHILGGFSEAEASDLIMSKLSKLTVHVTDVDSTITAATYAKTGGSPLFLQMIIDVLFVKVGGDFIVNGDGILTVRDESVRAEAILTDLSAAILFQFDRLDATFQRILKVACVLGQYFNLRNVLDLGDFDMDVAECVELIKDSDIYSFLVCDQPTSSNLPQETADNVEDGAECSFRHISIMNTIYESLAFEERLAANSCVGNMIENIINDDNRDSLLPSLEYHFSRSADVERIVGYKEELGLSLMGKFQTIEGVRILESLVEYVKQASPEDLDMLAEPVTALRKAKWFERLCSGYSLNRSFPKERDAGIAALNYLGAAPWPSGDNEIKIALKKTERRLYINWILTFGGRMRSQPPKRTSPHSTQSKSMAMAQRIELEKAILFSMAEALGYDKAFTGEERLYLVMRHCNLMIRTNNNSIDWTAVLHKVVYYGNFVKPKICVFFQRAADASDEGCDRPSHLFMRAINMPNSSAYRDCVPLLLKIHSISKSQYDVYFEHLSLTYAAVIAFQEGRFKTIDEIVESYYRTSATVKDDPIICYQLLYVLYRVALVRGDADAIAEWQAAYEPRSAAARLFNYGIDASECIQTMLAAQIGNFDVALNHLQEYLAVFTKLELSGDMADTALFVPLLVILFFDPVRSGLPVAGVTSIKNCIPTPWGQEDLTRLRIIIGTMKAVMKAFGITHHHVMSFWFHELYVIVELLLEGRKNEAMSMAKRKLRCRRKAELEGLPTQKAMYHGLIAKYATSSSDAAKSREIAANIFKEQNSQLYLKWLNS